MTRNTFFAALMMGLMTMFATSANAQGRMGGHPGNAGREMHISSHGGVQMRGGRDMGHRDMGHREMDRHHEVGHAAPHHMGHGHGVDHRWDDRGYLHGWDGRVRRFADGRWGYYRDGAWLYYDCFYEPDYYYAHPVAHFHAHRLNRTERAVVGAVAGIATVAAIIGAIAH